MLFVEMRFYDNDFGIQAEESMVQLKDTLKFMMNYPEDDMKTYPLALRKLLKDGSLQKFFITELTLRSALRDNSTSLWRPLVKRESPTELDRYLTYFSQITVHLHTDDAFSKEWQNSERVSWNVDTGKVKIF